MTNEQFKALLLKFKQQQLTREELDLFLEAAALPERESMLGDLLVQDLEAHKPGSANDPEAAEKVWNNIAAIRQEEMPVQVPWFRRWKWAAAAAVLAAVSIWVWKMNNHDAVDQLAVQPAPVITEPKRNAVVLTLSDGSNVLLDSAHSGTVTDQGKVNVVKGADGQISYQVTDSKLAAAQPTYMNAMSTPAGSQYNFTLQDGTRVWLNAASSITYPVVFTGKERKVLVTGEVYFEVQQDKERPFIVNVNDRSRVEVLGTAFNINAYNNEASINTTLLNGSVLVGASDSEKKNTVKLRPGEQAQQAANSLPVVAKDVNKEKVMAWKTGLFDFNNASLDEVMREIARWYDIQVVYEKGIPDIEFVGKISRKLTLQQVLNGLQGTGFKFRIENNRRLVILP